MLDIAAELQSLGGETDIHVRLKMLIFDKCRNYRWKIALKDWLFYLSSFYLICLLFHVLDLELILNFQMNMASQRG